MKASYDRIGVGYSKVRRPDPRLAALITQALGDARTVLNVGAGAGSYEPAGPRVVAVEPSAVMLAQHGGTDRVRAAAEALPFPGQSFDAAMAIMTIHHWTDLAAGLAEMRRVSRRQVVFTWDKDHAEELWVIREYVPEIRTLEHARFPRLGTVVQALGAHTVQAFPIPCDFTDGYQPAFWQRPEAYLDAGVRAASSTFATLPGDVVEPAMRRLAADLASGAWARRHEDLLHRDTMDYGYRLIISG
ncbi:MAG TPA: class I SAM-dependent methyltransferase [Streptosporangiaceae bacterium]